MEYCRLNVEGEFLNDREFLIRPRGRFDKSAFFIVLIVIFNKLINLIRKFLRISII